MPPFESFRDAASYVAVLSHEATHWTAGSHRVDRDLSRYAKDRNERAREELIAELGSCFLCADLGIAPELEPRSDHARYLSSWLKVLADDKRAIFSAAAHARRAVAFLHSLQPAAFNEREAPDVHPPNIGGEGCTFRISFTNATFADGPREGGRASRHRMRQWRATSGQSSSRRD